MTNVKRIFQKLDENNQPLYALEQFNEYLVIQGYDESQDYESIAQEYKQDFSGIYLKRRFYKEGNHTQLLTGKAAPKKYEVIENDLKFQIRFEEHMDIGLFLDHRISREMIEKESHNKDVLNLFAYTGSFSLYAVRGGASSVTTVDLSNTYIDWAKENFELNDMTTESPHEFWAMSTNEFIDLSSKTGTKYDIIVCDPPSFSRDGEETWQVQKDHKELIRTLQNRMLKKFGMLLFSTNLQTFKLDDYLRPGADKLTKLTIPEEFKPFKPHQTYVFYN